MNDAEAPRNNNGSVSVNTSTPLASGLSAARRYAASYAQRLRRHHGSQPMPVALGRVNAGRCTRIEIADLSLSVMVATRLLGWLPARNLPSDCVWGINRKVDFGG